MAINPQTKRVKVMLIIEDTFSIEGFVYVPPNMRISDAMNKFLRETQFLPVVEAEIKLLTTNTILEKRDFILVAKDKILVLAPLSE